MEAHIFLILLLCSSAVGACVYTQQVAISVPNLEALSGSCLLIPCTFNTSRSDNPRFDPTKPVTGIWRKNNFHGTNVLDSKVNIIGDLHKKNCTTLFSDINSADSDKYYFRIENGGFKVTDPCSALQIKVKDSPWRPSVQISGPLRENESVTVTCSAQTPCPHSPPKLSWNLHQNPPHTLVTNTDGTFSTSIQQKMTLSDRHHGFQVNCSAVYPVDGGEKKSDRSVSLRVKYAPRDTSVQFTADTSLSLGRSVNLSCSSRAWPPVNITWFRVTSDGPQRVHEGHVYSLIFCYGSQGQYFCQAKNEVGEQNSLVFTLQPEDAKRGIGPYNVVQICGIVLLFIALLFIECLPWIKTTKCQQSSVTEEPDYVNRVVESQV